MNILIISPNKIWGGAATANLSIAKLLQSKGNRVLYVDEFCLYDEYDGIPISHEKFARGAKTKHDFHIYVQEHAIDVVIWGVMMVMPYYYLTIHSLAKRGIRQLAIFHSLSLAQNLKGMLLEKLVACSVAPLNTLVYVSGYTKKTWEGKYMSFRKKNADSIVIHNPIAFSPSATARKLSDLNRIKIGFVGRFSEEKQPEVFCELSSFPELSCYAWGEGILLEKLQAKYQNVSFMGLERDIDKIYSNIDILVVTSIFENCPMVILEAMAKGIPCVAPDVGGIGEILQHGNNGRLFKEYSSLEILTEINLVLDSYGDYSQRCIKESHKYTFNALWEKWEIVI